ncbi:MAG TPA: carboxypeptidase-like regulatory domain-containing protein [Candidatus Polarisedimenticolia bacterium]|nr:carboxypeptidase-like regulatory domain-containing protein [Candidatus Polarisedimenticolia bacterium]
MEGTTRRAGAFHRLVAVMLTLAIAGYWVPSVPRAAATRPVTAGIRGNVVRADGLTAVAGVSVKAANMGTKTVYSSPPTGKDGVYSLSNLPPGTYDLAVETPQGLYPSDSFIDAATGRWTIVSLSLRGVEDPPAPPPENPPAADPNAPAAEPEKPKEEGKKDEAPPEPQPQDQKKKKKKGSSFWKSPGGAAIAIVVGGVLIGAAANSSTNDKADDNDKSMTSSGN